MVPLLWTSSKSPTQQNNKEMTEGRSQYNGHSLLWPPNFGQHHHYLNHHHHYQASNINNKYHHHHHASTIINQYYNNIITTIIIIIKPVLSLKSTSSK